MKQVIIDRSKWRTGCAGPNATGSGATKLKNEQGFMCCLGFIARSYKKKICGIMTPVDANCYIPHLTVKSIHCGDIFGCEDWEDSNLSEEAFKINDDEKTTRQEKEKLLKKLFKGKIDLKFVGRSVKFTQEGQ